MSEKIFGEIQNTEELNELAVNLRKNKEFDEIRLLCSENHISEEDAEEFIQGKRLHLADPGHQEKSNPMQSPVWDAVRASMKDGSEHAEKEKSGEEAAPMDEGTPVDIVTGTPKLEEDKTKAPEELAEAGITAVCHRMLKLSLKLLKERCRAKKKKRNRARKERWGKVWRSRLSEVSGKDLCSGMRKIGCRLQRCF